MAAANIPFCQGPDPQPTTPTFSVPRGTIDTHAHVFGPESAYPYSPARGYTPPDASLADWVPDAATLQKILVENPNALYGRFD